MVEGKRKTERKQERGKSGKGRRLRNELRRERGRELVDKGRVGGNRTRTREELASPGGSDFDCGRNLNNSVNV